ncbi:hypothetical protein NC651_036350 [Populus alba x Populus x berolinensis]|nr:hypothetical protein NC651_036350 [Populus alba x Populus x berolinensis]
MILLSLGSGEAPLSDIVAYAGYTFTGMCFAVLGKILSGYSYYILMPCACLCMGIFLVKTMKRVLFAEVRSFDSRRSNFLGEDNAGLIGFSKLLCYVVET